MRIRTIMGGVAAIATCFAIPAAAWIPGNSVFALSGTINRCELTGTLLTNYNSTAPALITAVSVSGGAFCVHSFTGTPYEVTALSSTSVRIRNFRIVGPTGECRGDLTGSWNNATGQINIYSALASVDTGQPPCLVRGTISTTPRLFM